MTEKIAYAKLHPQVALAVQVCSGSGQYKCIWALIDACVTDFLMHPKVHAIWHYESHNKKDDLKSWKTGNGSFYMSM